MLYACKVLLHTEIRVATTQSRKDEGGGISLLSEFVFSAQRPTASVVSCKIYSHHSVSVEHWVLAVPWMPKSVDVQVPYIQCSAHNLHICRYRTQGYARAAVSEAATQLSPFIK